MLLSMTGIGKSFPGVKALADVDITLERGEVLGIVGRLRWRALRAAPAA